MPRILLTAFGPYDQWESNSSWMTLQSLVGELPSEFDVVTRLYPVDYDELAERLRVDLDQGVDVALHLGQSPGSGQVELEAVGLNLACDHGTRPEQARPLVEEGPPAFMSALPLGRWAQQIRDLGIPAEVSHHAGTFLCNASLYLAHYIASEQQLSTRAAFVHLPLDPSQVVGRTANLASQPVELSARALRVILDDIVAGGAC